MHLSERQHERNVVPSDAKIEEPLGRYMELRIKSSQLLFEFRDV